MPGQPSPDIVQIGLRVRKDLRRLLIAAAKKSGISLNAEIVDRLERSFERVEADKILDKAYCLFDEAERINAQTKSTFAELAEIEKEFKAAQRATIGNALLRPARTKK